MAVGLEDGTKSLHDVEDESGNFLTYEDHTPRFFPPAPRAPQMHVVVFRDAGFMDDSEDSYSELSNSSYQRFKILCSGDKDGRISFSVFSNKWIDKNKELMHNLQVSIYRTVSCCLAQD